MKSILNEVNRLEKAWDLFLRLVESCNHLSEVLEGTPVEYNASKKFNETRRTANAFLEKYG